VNSSFHSLVAIERSWALGVLLVLFFGGVIIADDKQLLQLPTSVREWAGAGVLFGLAAIGLSIIAAAQRGIKSAYDGAKVRSQRKRDFERTMRDALDFLPYLSVEELELFQVLLQQKQGSATAAAATTPTATGFARTGTERRDGDGGTPWSST
jgi:hypothetical protein